MRVVDVRRVHSLHRRPRTLIRRKRLRRREFTLDGAYDPEEFASLLFVPVATDDHARVVRTIILVVVASDLVDGQLPDVRNVTTKVGGVGEGAFENGRVDMYGLVP